MKAKPRSPDQGLKRNWTGLIITCIEMVNRLTCLFVYNRKLLPLVYLVIAMKLSMVRIWWTLLECRKWKQASSMAIARCILWLVLDLYIPKQESKQPTNSMHNKFCWCRRNNNNKKLLKDNITRRVLLCIVFVFLFCFVDCACVRTTAANCPGFCLLRAFH